MCDLAKDFSKSVARLIIAIHGVKIGNMECDYLLQFFERLYFLTQFVNLKPCIFHFSLVLNYYIVYLIDITQKNMGFVSLMLKKWWDTKQPQANLHNWATKSYTNTLAHAQLRSLEL